MELFVVPKSIPSESVDMAGGSLLFYATGTIR